MNRWFELQIAGMFRYWVSTSPVVLAMSPSPNGSFVVARRGLFRRIAIGSKSVSREVIRKSLPDRPIPGAASKFPRRLNRLTNRPSGAMFEMCFQSR